MAGVAVAALALSACKAEAKKDLGQQYQEFANPEVVVYRLPDGFPNITTFCIDADRIYATTRDMSSLTVITGGCRE